MAPEESREQRNVFSPVGLIILQMYWESAAIPFVEIAVVPIGETTFVKSHGPVGVPDGLSFGVGGV